MIEKQNEETILICSKIFNEYIMLNKELKVKLESLHKEVKSHLKIGDKDIIKMILKKNILSIWTFPFIISPFLYNFYHLHPVSLFFSKLEDIVK